MDTQQTITWLKVASAIVIGFGLLLFTAAHPATQSLTLFLTDLIFWPVDGNETLAAPESRLLSAISGGIMVGWGLLLWWVATRLYPRDSELARQMIFVSIGSWFIVDSLGSVMAGAPLNVGFNLLFLAMFFYPLRRPSTARAQT